MAEAARRQQYRLQLKLNAETGGGEGGALSNKLVQKSGGKGKLTTALFSGVVGAVECSQPLISKGKGQSRSTRGQEKGSSSISRRRTLPSKGKCLPRRGKPAQKKSKRELEKVQKGNSRAGSRFGSPLLFNKTAQAKKPRSFWGRIKEQKGKKPGKRRGGLFHSFGYMCMTCGEKNKKGTKKPGA